MPYPYRMGGNPRPAARLQSGHCMCISANHTLGIAPDVIIVGIEGGQMPGFSTEIDPAVRAAIPEACRIVAEEARR